MISFEATPDDLKLISEIVDRAIGAKIITGARALTLTMDLTACHANGNPLQLAEMLNGLPLDFFHDISGIMRHINRDSGKLEDFFIPRFSA